MSRPRKPRRRSTSPDPTRFVPCARCGDCYPPVARWPEGVICDYCYQAARRRDGTCADCGHVGMVPGINQAKQPTCLRCSGLPFDLTCAGCGAETWLAKKATCWRCLLNEIVTDLLSGPDGTIPDELAPLADAICSMRRPNSGVTWIRANPRVKQLLRALGEQTVALNHDAFDQLPRSRTVEYIRELLVHNGILPPRDRNIATFEHWLQNKLDTIDDIEHRRLIERFARWHHLRQLRRQTENGPVADVPMLGAKQSIAVSINFLAWLGGRGRPLAECTQHDIDTWYASGPSTHDRVERFLYWARTQRVIGKIDVPRRHRDNPDLLGENEWLDVVRRLLLLDTLPLQHRVAGCLIALFGQTVSRIVRLQITDIQADDQTVRIKLGRDWTDIPEPVAALVRDHLARRANTNTAANPDTPWLFAGATPGMHLDRMTLLNILRNAGIPTRATRNTSWQQLVRDAPPQILADTLGISPATAVRMADQAAADWTTYAASRSERRR